MNFNTFTQRLERVAEHIPPVDQRFRDALPHELAMDFVDVSQWKTVPRPYDDPKFDLARHLCDMYVVFDEEAFDALLDDLAGAADFTAALWRLRLHVEQHPPIGEPGQAPWPAFLQEVSNAHFDLFPGERANLSVDEQERLLERLLTSLRADLHAGTRYAPEWVRFVDLLEQGAFA